MSISPAHQKLIEERAETIRQEFLKIMTRKLKFGGIDASTINNNHGNAGLAPVTASALRELASQAEYNLNTTGKKIAANLDCF